MTKTRGWASLFVIALVAPQIAFAAWWNPLSWNWFSFFIPHHQIQTVATTTTPTASTTSVLPNSLTVQQMIELQKEASTPANPTKKNPTKVTPSVPAKTDSSNSSSPTPSTNPVPTSPVSPPVSQPPQVYSTQQLGGALSSVYTQLALNFVKTAAPHLATIAGTEQSRLNILQNGRMQCVQTYSSDIATAQQQVQQYQSSSQTQMYVDQAQQRLTNLQQQESGCEAAYPTVNGDLSAQIDNAVHQLAALYARIQAGAISDTEAISILQQYNSLESEIYDFNSAIPSPVAYAAPNVSIPNISSNIGTKPQPVYSGGTITCTSGNFSVNCSDGTTCSTVGMNVLNCSGPGGVTTSCKGNFVMGGTVTCTQ